MALDSVGILGNKNGRLGRFMLGRIPSANATSGGVPCPYIPSRIGNLGNQQTFSPRMASVVQQAAGREQGVQTTSPAIPTRTTLDTTAPRPIPTPDTAATRKKECR